jgi:hypothetical protein
MKPGSIPSTLKNLWEVGFFSGNKSFAEVEAELASSFGINSTKQAISNALRRSGFLRIKSSAAGQIYVQKYPAKAKSVPQNVVSDALRARLGSPFVTSFRDLDLNYGNSGTCTAFLLRKILEKALRIVIGKHSLELKFQDAAGKYFGLERMIDIASKEKLGGKPILEPKVAGQIQGIKFLGDTAAHDPWIEVESKIIEPQMPFYWVAITQISQHF